MRRLLLLVCLPAILAAQNTSSTLSGTVHDPAGAVVPSAKVVLTGEGNGFVMSVNISNEAPGFKTYKQTGILINAAEHRSLGQIKLQVGQVSDSVTVTAEAVTVNTSNGERSGTLSRSE